MDENLLDVYREYCAIKTHFNKEEYDYFKYNGRIKCGNFSNYEKIGLIKLLRNYKKSELKNLFVSNIVSGRSGKYLNYFTNKEAREIYDKWLKGIQSMTYVIECESKDIKKLLDDSKLTVKDLLAVKDGKHPLLLMYYYAGEISLETLIAYAIIFKFLDDWNKAIREPVVWPETYKLIKKYRPFLVYDIDKIKNVFRKIYLEN